MNTCWQVPPHPTSKDFWKSSSTGTAPAGVSWGLKERVKYNPGRAGGGAGEQNNQEAHSVSFQSLAAFPSVIRKFRVSSLIPPLKPEKA